MVEEKEFSISSSYKRCIAQEKQKSVGNPNGVFSYFYKLF